MYAYEYNDNHEVVVENYCMCQGEKLSQLHAFTGRLSQYPSFIQVFTSAIIIVKIK